MSTPFLIFFAQLASMVSMITLSMVVWKMVLKKSKVDWLVVIGLVTLLIWAFTIAYVDSYRLHCGVI
jgi:hypothetical protein